MSGRGQRILTLALLLALAAPAARASSASSPYDACTDIDDRTGMGQTGLQPDAFYRCTATGATQQWIPQSVVVGQTPTTCDANNAGRLYWDRASISLKVCNGTSGVAVGSGSTILGSTATGANPQRSGDATTGLFSPAASAVSIVTAGTEAVRVDGSQNVGVGSIAAGSISLDVGSRTNAVRPAVGTTAQQPTCNAGLEGALRYNTTKKGMEFCNGSAWSQIYQVQSTPAVTAPSGSGYFVLTDTTYNGNLGGISGADTKCLTELGTTYTSWRGYSTANSNGQITAAKVKAFICDMSTCNNLMPLTTYYFAYANSGTPGGASFTTDSNGLGPGDSNAWSAANYFSGTYTYWTGRADNTTTTWYGATTQPDYATCSAWTSNASAQTGIYGNSATTDRQRWSVSGYLGCNLSKRLICFVNP